MAKKTSVGRVRYTIERRFWDALGIVLLVLAALAFALLFYGEMIIGLLWEGTVGLGLRCLRRVRAQ